MPTIIDSIVPNQIIIPRDDCVEVVITAHNNDAQPTVLGDLKVQVGDQLVTITATLPGSDSTPVDFGLPVLSSDLVLAGVTIENQGNGHYLVCGPNYNPATHEH